jgi:hypothetical protein
MFESAVTLSLPTDPISQLNRNRFEFSAGRLSKLPGQSNVGVDYTGFRNMLAASDQRGNLSSPEFSNATNRFEGFAKTVNALQARNRVDELVFIDRSVAGWGKLLLDLDQQKQNGRNLDVVLLDTDRNGVHQISRALERYSDVQSVHIVSHGSAGRVQLGNGELNGAAWQGYMAEVGAWGQSLSGDADILFYGCNLTASAEGRQLARNVQLLTGADVAASSDVTGSVLAGGDWDLEFQLGQIETTVFLTASAQSAWDGTLQVNIDQAWLDAQGPGPYYLDQAGETYVLQTDVTTAGSAFGIIADDIVFDLNGHTVTYNDAAPISIVNHSFESGTGASADGWDFSAAASAERYQGVWINNEVYDGDHSLRFAPSSENQTAVSTSLVTLEANTTYSLSGMFYKKNISDVTVFVEIENTSDGLVHRAEYSGINNRGIQWEEEVFTTGSSSDTYQMRVGVEGAFTENQVFVDDIKIQRTRTYGVAVSVFGWAATDYVDFTSFGSSENSEIRNGNIVQGQDGGTWSHGFYVRQAHDTILDNVNVTVAGANSSAVYWASGDAGSIQGSQFTSNVNTIGSRDASHGAVVMQFQGTFANNQINNGPHMGLYLSDKGASQVYGNTIKLKTKYTNGFGIAAWGDGTEVYDNLIDCGHADYSARGIFIRGSEGIRRVFDNTIRVQGFANNQEYSGNGGVQLGGVYGIQIENDSNAEIFGNAVFVNAEQTIGYAFRANGVVDNVNVYENTFEVENNGSRTAIFRLAGQDSAGLNIHDNTLITNDGIIGLTTDTNIDLIRSNLHITPIEGARLFEAGYMPQSNTEVHSSVRLVDTLFANQESRDAVAAASFVGYVPSGPAEPRAEFSVVWSTDFLVKDFAGGAIANAAVVVNDSENNEVFNGITDSDGHAGGLLSELHTVGDVNTVFGSYTAIATSQNVESSATFLADQTQVIDIELGVNPPSHGDYTLIYNGTTLFVDATDGHNEFYWSADSPLDFNIDGLDFTANEGTEKIHFRGAEGNDSVSLIGSTDADILNATDGSMVLTTPEMKIVTSNIESIDVELGSGSDNVYFNGTAGDDAVTVSADVANFSGSGVTITASGFERVVARESAGLDSVLFLDTAANERFYSYATYSVMFVGSTVLRANGFESVTGRSENGGWDIAKLVDTAGDDSLYADNQLGRLTDSAGSVREAQGFDRTIITSSGGNDTADLNGSSGNDTALGSMDSLIFKGDGFSYRLDGYSEVTMSSGLGEDALYLNDTQGDDILQLQDGNLSWSESSRNLVALQFETYVINSVDAGQDTVQFLGSQNDDQFYSFAGSEVAFMVTSGSTLRATGFEQVTALSNGGNDRAVMKGSAGFDNVTITSGMVEVTNTAGVQSASGFAETYTYLENNGDDSATLSATAESDTLVGCLDWVRSYGNGYSNFIQGFQSATVDAGEGADAFYLKDSAEDDQFVIRSGFTSASNLSHSIVLNNFETQVATSINGGTDSIQLFDSEFNDNLYSASNFTSMQNSQTFHRANGFALVSAYAHNGGVDNVEMHGTDDPDQIDLEQDHGTYSGGGLDRYFEGFDHADIYLDMAQDTSSVNDVWFNFELIDE